MIEVGQLFPYFLLFDLSGVASLSLAGVATFKEAVPPIPPTRGCMVSPWSVYGQSMVSAKWLHQAVCAGPTVDQAWINVPAVPTVPPTLQAWEIQYKDAWLRPRRDVCRPYRMARHPQWLSKGQVCRFTATARSSLSPGHCRGIDQRERGGGK